MENFPCPNTKQDFFLIFFYVLSDATRSHGPGGELQTSKTHEGKLTLTL